MYITEYYKNYKSQLKNAFLDFLFRKGIRKGYRYFTPHVRYKKIDRDYKLYSWYAWDARELEISEDAKEFLETSQIPWKFGETDCMIHFSRKDHLALFMLMFPKTQTLKLWLYEVRK